MTRVLVRPGSWPRSVVPMVFAPRNKAKSSPPPLRSDGESRDKPAPRPERSATADTVDVMPIDRDVSSLSNSVEHTSQPSRDESNAGEDSRRQPTHPAMTELVAAAKLGDQAAWTNLYRANFSRLYRHVGYLVGDASTAEDLTQEIFARALASLHRFDGRSAFSTWLFGIASNTVYKHWRSTGRKRRAYAAYELTPPPAGQDPEAAHLTKQRAAALRVALDELPPHQREAFVLLDLQQLSPRDAAERLGITPGNLAVRASRARARIRKQLADAGWITATKTEVSS